MTNLDNYKPYESPFCGHDLNALILAKQRMSRAASNPALPWIIREMAMELMTAGSIQEYETIRSNYAELVQAVCS